MPKYHFIGFSTVNRDDPRQWKVYNKELIKRDILNELNTRKGERVMLADYGCIIWDMIMEPLTEANKEAIASDIQRIVTKDTRVRLISLNLEEIHLGVRVSVTLEYIPYKTVESFETTFQGNLAGTE